MPFAFVGHYDVLAFDIEHLEFGNGPRIPDIVYACKKWRTKRLFCFQSVTHTERLASWDYSGIIRPDFNLKVTSPIHDDEITLAGESSR